jgi:CubicO group peptidase (beta-lactamase class C family)
MRITAAFTTASLIAGATLAAATIVNSNTAARAETVARGQSEAEIEQLVRRHVQPMLIAAGGMAVALSIDGRTLFFNYGMADVARKTPITSDSLFNLASVGKAFIATLLAEAVKRGEVSLDDPVAKYVTELQQGGDIRKVTLGQLASHTSGLTRTPKQYEPDHRGQYSLPDFIRYLNAWQADEAHQPGQQDIYSNTGFVLLSLALQRRLNTPIAQLMETRLLAPLGMSAGSLRRSCAAARCRATIPTRSRWASPASSRACSTGPAPGRCIRPRATWRDFLPPISARYRTMRRYATRWRWHSRAYSRWVRASPRRWPGSG